LGSIYTEGNADQINQWPQNIIDKKNKLL